MANTLNKQNIEAIFPLTNTQQKLLFHSLTSSFDQGFLNLQCDLEGVVDPIILEKAWNITIQRHAIMRTTVHWEKIEKPVQIVHKSKSVTFEFIDWKNYASEDKKEKWKQIKNMNRTYGVDFTKGALLQVKLIHFEANFYRLLWTNHHLLLDGWSSNNILRDVFSSYEVLLSKNVPSFEALPSHKSYLRWVGQNKPEDAKMFWESYFVGMNKTYVFNPTLTLNEPKSISVEGGLTEYDTTELKKFAKQSKVTLNVVVQSIWSLLLFRYFNVTDTTHGTTVSGRSSDFKNIDLLSGMYSKVHPVRNFIENDDEILTEWLGKIQKRQLNALRFEHLDLDEITPYAANDLITPLFDSLLIFENYPIVASEGGTVVVSNFKSGVTSTYPVTMVVLPGKNLRMVLTISAEKVKDDMAEWLLSTFVRITKMVSSNEVKLVSALLSKIDSYDLKDEEPIELSKDKLTQQYVSPRNDLEKQLVKVWEEVFRIKDIGVVDNFFSLGGKSLIAVKMFAKLTENYGLKLPPTTLLEYPTIAEVANLIKGGNNTSNDMEFMIPLRPSGTKAPLFCVHAGGGHVFFYNKLPNYLNAERPVYALQPSGIDGKTKLHNSITEMTSDYLGEIKQIQPKGPYHIMVYCFGTAVGVEMIKQLKETNEEVHIMVMDTMSLQEKVTTDRFIIRAKYFGKRFMNEPIKSFNTMITDRVERYLKPFWVNLYGSIQDKNLEVLKKNLVVIYKKYKWQKVDGEIDLIITKKATESLNAEIIESWQKLVKDVSILNIQGNHRTLFEEPDVRFVGEKLEERMAYKEKK